MTLNLTITLDFAMLLILVSLSASMVLAFIRLIQGPSLLDRVISLELIATIVVGIIAAYGVAFGQPVFLDVAIVLSLVGFLGAIAFARYLEKSVHQ
jgi:multicomponent Na+:H+ antiporter subunit F